MKKYLPITIILMAVLVSLFGFLVTGCEPYQAITFENKTAVPVKVNLYNVSRDYTDIPTMTWNDPGAVVIGAGESKTYVTQVPNKRVTWYKYVGIAVTETNEVVLSKIFTWDELHDANWKVIIQ
jgi:hypothetical protein